MNDDMERFIDVLHAIKFIRHHLGSGADSQHRIDELISMLIAGQRNMTSGMPTAYAEIAKRIIEAEANWNSETGKTHCGQMSPI